MLMKDSKKKGIALILAKMKGPKVEEESAVQPDQPMEDDSIALESAADEVLAAVERKDPKMLKDALMSMIDMCMSKADVEEDKQEIENE